MNTANLLTTLSTVAAAISAVAAVIVALIVVKQLKSLYAQHRDTHDWNRRKTTIDMANSIIQGEEYRNLRSDLLNYGVDIRDTSRTSDEIFKSLSEEDARATKVLLRRMFNLFECFCVALKHNIVDEVIAKDMLMLFFVFWYHKCRPYLLEQNRGEEQQGMYGEFLVYTKRWASEYEKEVSQQGDIYVYRSKREARTPLGQ